MRKYSFVWQISCALGIPLSFLLGGCDRTEISLESRSYAQIEQATVEYLHQPNFLKEIVGADAVPSQTFCAYQIYGTEAKIGGKLYQYLWVLCQEYNFMNSQIEAIRAGNFPVALSFKKQNERYEVISHEIPREGKESEADLKKMFPDYILENINFPLNNSDYGDYLFSKLHKETLESAKSYFQME